MIQPTTTAACSVAASRERATDRAALLWITLKYIVPQIIGRGMIAEARVRFRERAFALCHSDAERHKAILLESAIGEVSPEEAVYAFKLWLDEHRTRSAPPVTGTPDNRS